MQQRSNLHTKMKYKHKKSDRFGVFRTFWYWKNSNKLNVRFTKLRFYFDSKFSMLSRGHTHWTELTCRSIYVYEFLNLMRQIVSPFEYSSHQNSSAFRCGQSSFPTVSNNSFGFSSPREHIANVCSDRHQIPSSTRYCRWPATIDVIFDKEFSIFSIISILP